MENRLNYKPHTSGTASSYLPDAQYGAYLATRYILENYNLGIITAGKQNGTLNNTGPGHTAEIVSDEEEPIRDLTKEVNIPNG